MSGSLYAETLQRITAADLPPATERFALRLLAEVNSANGHVNLTWERLEELTGIANRGAARRHLTRMKQSRIAHYDTNDYVYVTFFAWPDAPGRARGRADGRVGAPECEAEPVVAEGQEGPPEAFGRVGAPAPARGRAENAGVLVGMGGMVDLNSDPDQDQPYQPPTPDRRWVFDLLTDPAIDMMTDNAAAAARLNGPDYALKCVAAWWVMPDRRSAGLLFTWLVKNATNPEKRHRPGPAPAEFLATEFYRRHYDRAWEMAGDKDPPRWVLDLPDPPRIVEIDIGGGQMLRIPDDAAERRRKYGGGT